jgi:large subunit ribosomal protein L15
MNLSSLKPAEGSVRKNKRLGRGTGSGKGGTSTRGHKGAQSRSGYSSKRGFEGGQMALQRRLPKFGFINPFRIEYHGINLDILQSLADKKKITSIDFKVLVENGIASKREKVKILGRGELKSKLDIMVHAYSDSAKKAIEAQGGTAGVIDTSKKK